MVIYRTKTREELMAKAREDMKRIAEARKNRPHDPRLDLLKDITIFCGPVIDKTKNKAVA